MRFLWMALFLAVSAVPAEAQFTFVKVESRTAFGAAKQGQKGKLVIDKEKVRFTYNDGRTEFFSIPSGAVKEIFYSRVSGRRIGAAIALTPFLLFSKGRKHYMTLAFNDGDKLVGAVEFKLHKSNYRGVLRTIEEITGLSMEYDQEGVKDTKQTVASRKGSAEKGTVKITSDPEGAEIEVDGAFTGITPRTRALTPGEHTITLRKKGHKAWGRKIAVEAGETLEVNAELESK